MERLLNDHTPELMEVFGVGRDTAAQLLNTAGDNPARLCSKGAFAALTGACPIPASSGQTNRHRLNRAGGRQANFALYHVVIVRIRYDQATWNYVERRIAEGKTKMETIRCTKRYLVRQLDPVICRSFAGRTLTPTA